MKVTYSKKIKAELIKQIVNDKPLKTDFMTILMLNSNILFQQFPNSDIRVAFYNKYIAQYIKNTFKKFYDILCDISMVKIKSLTTYNILIPQNIVNKNIYDLSDFLDFANFIKSNEAYRSFIKCCFISNSSITNPNKSYHVEFIFDNDNFNSLLIECLNIYNIKSNHIIRKNKHIIYIKDNNSISNLFRVIGANKQLFEFENIVLLKEVRSNVNRKVNFETANLNRTVTSAVKQLNDINLLDEKIGIENLDKPLYEAAMLRLQYNEESLSDLAKLSRGNISKSGLYHRFKKIEKLAQNYSQ